MNDGDNKTEAPTVRRVGFLGGLPPVMAKGGLDYRIEHTERAMRRLGVDVERVERSAEQQPYDVVHSFGSEPGNWAPIVFWSRNRCPLVVSPALLGASGFAGLKYNVYSRIRRGPQTVYRLRKDVIDAADRLIALSFHERKQLIRLFGVDPQRVTVIPNGSDALVELQRFHPEEPMEHLLAKPARRYVLVVGNIQPRKMQLSLLNAVNGRFPLTFAGAYAEDLPVDAWRRLLDETGSTWHGEVKDRKALLDLYRGASALALLSTAEGYSNAVMDALALGIPVVLSNIPSHREMRDRWPDLVTIVSDPDAAVISLERILSSELPALPDPPVETWEQLALEILKVYDAATADYDAKAKSTTKEA